MYARVATFQFQPDKLEQVTQIANESIVPTTPSTTGTQKPPYAARPQYGQGAPDFVV